MTKRDYYVTYTDYRGNADESAAIEAFYLAADTTGLTYADLVSEKPSDAVKRAFGAAEDAAWPNRVTSDPSYVGHIEVFPLG